jgi:hypothetical protein
MAELRLDIPLVNQGCQALAALLDYDVRAAQGACHLLTLAELANLAVAADGLATIARGVSREIRPSYAHDKAVSDTRSYPSEPPS